LTINDISFESGKSNLTYESLKRLDNLIGKVNNVLIDSVLIKGHTDSIGTFENNKTLSANRSLSVLTYIQPKLELSPEKAIIRFYADTQPVESNKTVQGRRRNRRVEIFIYSHL
jgi:outer membrane protein OmpA-like peptidoglycan-associated protein